MFWIVGGVGHVDLREFAAPKWSSWGSHWFYRLLAEAASLAFGTFVAAGLARDREKPAAIIGGLTVSAFYLLRLSFLLFAYMYLDPEAYRLNEPQSQYIVDALVMIAAPLIGAGISHTALA